MAQRVVVENHKMEAFIGNRGKLSAAGAEAVRKAFGPFAALGRKDLAAALSSAAQLGLELPATARLAEIIETVFLDAGPRRDGEPPC